MDKSSSSSSSSASTTITADVLGEETHLHKAEITVPSERIPGQSYEVKLSDILLEAAGSMGMKDPSGKLYSAKNDIKTTRSKDVPPPPPLETVDGKIVSEEEAKDASARLLDMKISDNPHGYNPMESQRTYFPNRIDFGFLRLIIGKSNLGDIRELPSPDSSKVHFMLELPNRLSGNMAAQFGNHHLNVFGFSSFYPEFQSAEVAKDMSQGSHAGWHVIDSDWVKKAFDVYTTTDEKGEIVEEKQDYPYGYDQFDHAQFLIDSQTAILIRSYTTLPYERHGISMCFHKALGFISKVIVTGTYRKMDFPELVAGIFELLQDTANLRVEAGETIEKITATLAKQTKELGGDLNAAEVKECYEEILDIVFQDEKGKNLDLASVQVEGDGERKTMFIPDNKEEDKTEEDKEEKKDKEEEKS